jgi:serine O-acetyltransferase
MPIFSRTELREYLRSDLAANGQGRWRFYDRWRLPVLHFQRHLRRVEYIVNCRRGKIWAPYRAFARWRLREHGIKLGFTIFPNCFGPGLSIAHWGTIVVNADCRIGARCRIHPGTCLGWAHGKVPQLGDDCYIGPGAKLFGDIFLGDHTKVGANAVVTTSYPEGHTTLVGIPAKPLSTFRNDVQKPHPVPISNLQEFGEQ